MTTESHNLTGDDQPTVTLVFLVYNRRDELRESLRRMLVESDYPPERVDVIVVDNASTDGSAAMVRDEFPGVELVIRDRNIGVSGFNDGLTAARGHFVLALDDDCYLSPDGLRKAVAGALEHQADLVSFKVINPNDRHVFSDHYKTGLFMYWGCAVLMRREVIEALGGYDPEIFVWANELEFMLRFFDHGFRHLHAPDIVAWHMKEPKPEDSWKHIEERPYRTNVRHWCYIAGKLLCGRDAVGAFVAVVAKAIRDGLRMEAVAFKAVPDGVAGFVNGLRHRSPVRSDISNFYRRNFESFASPWWLARRPHELIRALPAEYLHLLRHGERPVDPGRHDQFVEERDELYLPERQATLQF